MAFEGKNLIGVDIGTSAVKVVQVRESGKGVHLMKYGVEPLPPQSIVDGHVMNGGAVVEALLTVEPKAADFDVSENAAAEVNRRAAAAIRARLSRRG